MSLCSRYMSCETCGAEFETSYETSAFLNIDDKNSMIHDVLINCYCCCCYTQLIDSYLSWLGGLLSPEGHDDALFLVSYSLRKLVVKRVSFPCDILSSTCCCCAVANVGPTSGRRFRNQATNKTASHWRLSHRPSTASRIALQPAAVLRRGLLMNHSVYPFFSSPLDQAWHFPKSSLSLLGGTPCVTFK